MWFHFVSFRLEGCREPCNDSTPEELSGSLRIFFQFFCKPTAEAMRKQFGSFAEAGTPISQPDRPAGEFLRFRQISAEAKPPWIRISRKACGRCWERFGIMFEFCAEAKSLENRIWRKPGGSLAEDIWIYFDFQRGSKAADEWNLAEAGRKPCGSVNIWVRFVV